MALISAKKPSDEKDGSLIETELLQNAVEMRASDVHIEPHDDYYKVRMRSDGVIKEFKRYKKEEVLQYLNQIKVLAGIDLMLHDTPLDGHFEIPGVMQTFNPEEKKYAPEKKILNVRVSIFPTIRGEAFVLRFFNKGDIVMPLEELGMDKHALDITREAINRPYGMLLTTGPAGSGKTTTLYSFMSEIADEQKNVVSLEDPVELFQGFVRQSEIKTSRGFTFAVAMRAILRQDPDVIMIGEIRDFETAENAARASLTGRLVLSSIHSNTTIGTIARLMDMGVKSSLIAYSVNAVIAQRLVRKICKSCAISYNPAQEILSALGIIGGQLAGKQFFKGAGCDACGHSGYFGRTGIFEILKFDDAFRSMIVEHASMQRLQERAEKVGVKTLRDAGIEKVLAGITTPEEILRAVI